MSGQSTIYELLQVGSADDIAISAPGHTGLSYRELREQVEQTVAALNRLGIGRNDRVAIG